MKAVRILSIAAAVALLGLLAGKHRTERESSFGRTLDPAQALASPPVLLGETSAKAPESPEAEWWGIYFREQKIGWGRQLLAPVSESEGGGWKSESESWFRLKMLDVTREVSIAERSHIRADYSLDRIDFSMRGPDVHLDYTASVYPDRIAVAIRSARSEQMVDIPRPAGDPPVYTPSVIYPWLRHTGIRAGETHKLVVFDSTTQSRQPLVLEVLGEGAIDVLGNLVPAWQVRQTLLGITTTAWISRDGSPLREETGDGFVLIRETAETARSGIAENPADFAEALSVSAGKPIRRQDRLTRLRVRLSGADFDGFDLDDARQEFTEDVFTIVRETLPVEGGYELPYPANGEWAEYLLPEPMVASDHPRIIAEARRITGLDASSKIGGMDGFLELFRRRPKVAFADPVMAARRLIEWVYRSVDKQPVFSLPNALDVLDRLKGDCNEHTVLLTALGRAAGIPTKQQAGLMHLEESGRFYYHAWVSFWTGDRWITADAVFNQFPADVTHIKFIDGGADRQSEISRLIGRLKLELLEAE